MAKTKKQAVRTSAKADVSLDVARCARSMRRAAVAERVSMRAPVYVAGALEPIVADIINGARSSAKSRSSTKDKGLKRVMVTDVITGVRTNTDLARLFSGFAFGSKAKSRKAIDYTLGAPEQRARKEQLKKSKQDREERVARDRAARAANASITND